MNFLEFTKTKAAECGWKLTSIHSDTFVSLKFNTSYGDETCFIQPVGKNEDGNTVLEFSSAGLDVPNDLSLAGQLALILLKRNATRKMGYWGIESGNQGNTYTVFVSMIANTLDTDEFRAAVNAILNERAWWHSTSQKNAIEF